MRLARMVLLAVVALLPRAAGAQGPAWTLDFVSSGSASAAVRSHAILTARARLSGSPAPAGGFTLSLMSSDPRVLSMPASVTVPAGRSEALFEIRAAAVSTSIRIDVRATGGGRTQALIVTVTPVSASAQSSASGGASASAGGAAAGAATWIPQFAGEIAAAAGRDARDWISLAGIASGLGVSWMPIYLPDLFPTAVRGSAISVVFNSARYLAAAGPLVAGATITMFGGIGRAASIIALVYVVRLIVTPFAGPETKGKPLPE